MRTSVLGLVAAAGMFVFSGVATAGDDYAIFIVPLQQGNVAGKVTCTIEWAHVKTGSSVQTDLYRENGPGVAPTLLSSKIIGNAPEDGTMSYSFDSLTTGITVFAGITIYDAGNAVVFESGNTQDVVVP